MKVGLIAPMSGPWARQGDLMLKGANLAIEHINAAGGIKALGGAKMKLLTFDAGDSVEKAKNAAQRMVAQEPDLVGVTGAWLSSFTLSVTEVTERAELPVLTLSYSDLLTSRGFKYVFQTSLGGAAQANSAVPALMKLAEAATGKKPKTVGIVMDNTASSVAFAKPMREGGLAKLGLKLVVDETFTPPLVGLHAADPEGALGAAGHPAAAADRDFRRQDVRREDERVRASAAARIPMISNGAHIGGPDMLQEFEQGDPRRPDDGGRQLDRARARSRSTKDFVKKTGEPWITQDSLSTYGDMWILKEALEKAGVADRKQGRRRDPRDGHPRRLGEILPRRPHEVRRSGPPRRCRPRHRAVAERRAGHGLSGLVGASGADLAEAVGARTLEPLLVAASAAKRRSALRSCAARNGLATAVVSDAGRNISQPPRRGGTMAFFWNRSPPAPTVIHADAERSSRIDHHIAGLIRDGDPGLVLAVVKAGAIVHAAGYGLADLDRNSPPGGDTIYHLASCGKQFTALGILMLAEERKLGLDDPLNRHLQGLAGFGPKVTLRHLLHHTSGIRDLYDDDGMEEVLDRCERPTNADIIRVYADLGCPMAGKRVEPGDRFSYSNSGYDMLGAVIERISGQSYHDFFQSRVFDRLDMKDTFSIPDRRVGDRRRATGYLVDEQEGLVEDQGSEFNDLVGSGSFYTTALDLCRYDQALAANSLVSEASMREALTSGRTNDGKLTDYGFGWYLGTYRGMSFADHDGEWIGFYSYICRYRDAPLSIFLLSNNPDLDLAEIVRAATDVFR